MCGVLSADRSEVGVDVLLTVVDLPVPIIKKVISQSKFQNNERRKTN